MQIIFICWNHLKGKTKEILIIHPCLHFFSLPAGPENEWPIIQVLHKHHSDTAPVWTGACIGVCVCVCVPYFGPQNKEAFNALVEGVVPQFAQFLNKSLRGIIKGLTCLPCFYNKLGHREG